MCKAFTAEATTVPGVPHLDAVNEGHLVFLGICTTLPRITGGSVSLCTVIEPPGKHSILMTNP